MIGGASANEFERANVPFGNDGNRALRCQYLSRLASAVLHLWDFALKTFHAASAGRSRAPSGKKRKSRMPFYPRAIPKLMEQERNAFFPRLLEQKI